MNAMSLRVQIKSLEVQLSVLKAQLTPGIKIEQKGNRFADLYGILSDKSDLTEENIQRAEYRFDWTGTAEG